jgi:DNA-binding response OmpR family regulator
MATGETVIVVDDNPSNLIAAKNVLSEKYTVFTAPSAGKLFNILKEINPALILLDIDMPITDGYRTLELLKKNKNTTNIPVIFLTGKYDVPSELEGLKLGAVDYITKPFVPELLLKRVESHIFTANENRALLVQNEQLEKQRHELNKAYGLLKKELREKDAPWEFIHDN